MNVPPEILQRIFIHVDGASLMRCQRVCSSWLREAKFCELRQHDFWKDRCVQEVRWEFLPSFIGKLFPNYFKDNTSVISWKFIYICWYRWKSLSKWPSKSNELVIKRPGRIMRAQFYGNWIVYGTNDFGALIACHMDSPTHKARILFQGPKLLDFVFISTQDPQKPPLSAVVIRTERDLTFFDLERDQLVGNCAPFTLSQWRQEINANMGEQLKTLNPDFKEIEDLELFKLIDNFNQHNERVFKNGEVLFEVTHTKSQWIQLSHNVAIGISDTPTYRHVIALVVGKKHKLYYPSVNFGNISTAMLHGNNFFVGTTNGMLHHYTIDRLEHFLAFDFLKFDWSIKIHELGVLMQDRILSIDVCELYNRPYIVLAVSICRIIIVDFMENEEGEEYFPNVLTSIR